MKLFVYSYREFDEAEFFQKFAEKYQVELGICHDAPTMENAYLAEGYPYVSIITTKIDEELMNRFHALGVKMISTRTIGYDHIDRAVLNTFNNLQPVCFFSDRWVHSCHCSIGQNRILCQCKMMWCCFCMDIRTKLLCKSY